MRAASAPAVTPPLARGLLLDYGEATRRLTRPVNS